MALNLLRRVGRALGSTRVVEERNNAPFRVLGEVIKKRHETVFSFSGGLLDGQGFKDSRPFTHYFIDVETVLGQQIPVLVTAEQYQDLQEGSRVRISYNLVDEVTLDYVPPIYGFKTEVGARQFIRDVKLSPV